MKTIREYIDLIESAQNPVKPIIAWVEPATCSTMSNDEYENNPFANETGDWKPIHTQEELAVWQDRREEKKRGQALGQNPVAEDWIDDDAAEPLARHFAELYYNGLSPADEAKMAAHVYQQVVDGEMSIEQLKQHIAKLEKEKGVAEGIDQDEYNSITSAVSEYEDEWGYRPYGQDLYDLARSLGVEADTITDVMYGRIYPDEGVAESTDQDVEHLANVAADAYWSGKFGMTSATEKVKMARDIVQAVEDGRLSIEELRQDIRDLDKPGVAEGQATRTCPQCDGSGEDTLDPTKSCRRCGGKGHIPMSPREQGVAEGKGLAKKVKIVKGPDAGKTGWIREVKHGAFKGAPKTYYIDLDDGGQANNLPATALRLVKEQGVAEGEISQQYTVAVDCGEDGTFTVKVHAGDKGEALRKAQKIVRNEYDTYPEGARIVGQGVAEALSKTDLLKQVSAKLNDPEFRKQPADPTKSFTRGDHWQGAKPGDYGYTGYQGHGMPTDRAERARIRADKKKQQDK